MNIKNQLTIISTLTLAEMKGRYRNTFAGVIWVMFNPLLMFTVHAIIFKYILKINVDRYFIFLLSGLIPWIFISTTLTQTVNTFIRQREALLSFQIHPISILLSRILDNFINFILPFAILFVILAPNEEFNTFGLMFVPLAMLFLFIGVSAMAIILSTLQVFFRDTEYIVNFVVNIMFFLTPIFYPRHLIPEKYQILVDLNPFYAYIRTFKNSLWSYSHTEIMSSLLNVSLFLGASIIIATFVWKRLRNELYLNI